MQVTSRQIEEILEKSTVVDMHFDLLMDVERQRSYGRRKIIEHDYYENFRKGYVDFVVASIFIDDIFLPEMALRKALDQISALYCEVDESSDKLLICRNEKDVERCKLEQKIGFILSFEGVEPLLNDANLIRVFYELGVRIVGLTWSRRNYAADGSHFKPVTEGRIGGVTAFGKTVIEKAEEMGMFIDVSHLNDAGFEDVLQFSRKPILASHSNCRSLVNSGRNLTDEQIQHIAAKNGLIGINAASIFVAESDEKSDVIHMADHIDHVKNLVGIEHIGLGFDFCDYVDRDKPAERFSHLPRRSFDVIKGHQCIGELIGELINRGYGNDELTCILGNNFLRLFTN